jgi:hypothetical protein
MENANLNTSVGEKKPFGSMVKKWALVLSIIVVLNLFFNYGIYTFYKGPVFDTFCKPELNSISYITRQSCETAGGLWNENYPQGVPAKITTPADNVQTGYCNIYYACQKSFDTVNSVYNRNVFVVLVVLGLASLVIGLLLSLPGVVSLGLSLGGVLSMIIGSIRYWSDMNDYLRFGLLGIALAVLVWLGIKKFKD